MAKNIFLSIIFFTTILFPLYVFALSPDEAENIKIYEEMGGGVVNITTTTISYDFFLNPIPEQGAGSGSIIDKKGHILTNFHVVENAKKLEVTLFDGSKWEAKVIGQAIELGVVRDRKQIIVRVNLSEMPVKERDR